MGCCGLAQEPEQVGLLAIEEEQNKTGSGFAVPEPVYCRPVRSVPLLLGCGLLLGSSGCCGCCCCCSVLFICYTGANRSIYYHVIVKWYSFTCWQNAKPIKILLVYVYPKIELSTTLVDTRLGCRCVITTTIQNDSAVVEFYNLCSVIGQNRKTCVWVNSHCCFV